MFASYNGDIAAWLTFWAVAHLLLQAVALVNIARKRNVTKTRLTVKWTLLVLFLPVLGFLGYYFHLMEEAIERFTTGRSYQEDAAPFLRSYKLSD
jgi:hypothetical protein